MPQVDSLLIQVYDHLERWGLSSEIACWEAEGLGQLPSPDELRAALCQPEPHTASSLT